MDGDQWRAALPSGWICADDAFRIFQSGSPNPKFNREITRPKTPILTVRDSQIIAIAVEVTTGFAILAFIEEYVFKYEKLEVLESKTIE